MSTVWVGWEGQIIRARETGESQPKMHYLALSKSSSSIHESSLSA